jgi:DNA-directed RNA polymerase specialized sigma24 family protein
VLLSLSPAAELTEIEPSVRIDCSSFQQFVLTHETAVFTFCYRMLGSAGMAETAAETAFLDACPHFPAVSLVDVLAAARGRCREVLQHQGRWRETAVSDVQHLFNQLPVPEREVMALRYGCKLNFSEIAGILNSSGQTVRDALRQGRWHAANLEQIRLADQY